MCQSCDNSFLQSHADIFKVWEVQKVHVQPQSCRDMESIKSYHNAYTQD